MKISELKNKKIFHVWMIIAIIVLILIIAGIIMLRYQVEGESDNNLPFEISKMIVVSTAEGQEIEAKDDNKWNFSVNQNNDIYISINKNEEYKRKASIKSLSFENINVQKSEGAENIKLYRSNDKGEISEEDKYLVQNYVTYEGEKEADLENLKISNQGGVLVFRSVNQNVCEVRSKDDEITHDGTLLAKGNVDDEKLKYTLTFDIVIETNRGIKYRGTVSIDLPEGNILEEGKGQIEKTDFSDIIFKRE